MKRYVLIAVFLLTVCIASVSRIKIVQAQTHSSIQSIDHVMSVNILVYNWLNLNEFKILNDSTGLKKNIIIEQKNCINNIKLSSSKVIRIEDNNTLLISGKSGTGFLPKDLINFFYTLNKENFFPLRYFCAETIGTKTDPTLFVSYYPGLLNEKVL
jgi:hypothetical protein